jgi:hypothetical protein
MSEHIHKFIVANARIRNLAENMGLVSAEREVNCLISEGVTNPATIVEVLLEYANELGEEMGWGYRKVAELVLEAAN